MNLSPSLDVMLPDGTTTGASTPINCTGFTNLTVFYTSDGTISGGTLIFEEAGYDPSKEAVYGGTWSQIESRSASSFTGGVTLARHYQTAGYNWVRVRISSDITGGGSVGVKLLRVP